MATTTPDGHDPAAPSSVRDQLAHLGDAVHDEFERTRRVMSFGEYLDLVMATGDRQLRSAAQFAVDGLDHYGTSMVAYPWGSVRRFHLFDCPWDHGRDRLIGQEEVQNQVHQALTNFVRDGAVNKLVLLHGPNGSAKSTLVRCLGRGLEHYSTLDEGALYRFHWLFPTERSTRGGDEGLAVFPAPRLPLGERT